MATGAELKSFSLGMMAPPKAGGSRARRGAAPAAAPSSAAAVTPKSGELEPAAAPAAAVAGDESAAAAAARPSFGAGFDSPFGASFGSDATPPPTLAEAADTAAASLFGAASPFGADSPFGAAKQGGAGSTPFDDASASFGDAKPFGADFFAPAATSSELPSSHTSATPPLPPPPPTQSATEEAAAYNGMTVAAGGDGSGSGAPTAEYNLVIAELVNAHLKDKQLLSYQARTQRMRSTCQSPSDRPQLTRRHAPCAGGGRAARRAYRCDLAPLRLPLPAAEHQPRRENQAQRPLRHLLCRGRVPRAAAGAAERAAGATPTTQPRPAPPPWHATHPALSSPCHAPSLRCRS